jgi:hypothetical protein
MAPLGIVRGAALVVIPDAFAVRDNPAPGT